MDKEGWFQLGYITKVHALRGEVILLLDVDFPEDYEGLEHVFVAKDSRFVPYFLEHFVLQPNKRGLAKFEGIESVEEAASLVGTEVYLPIDELPELGADQYYFHELMWVSTSSPGKLVITVTGNWCRSPIWPIPICKSDSYRISISTIHRELKK